MIKTFALFVVVAAIFHFAIEGWRGATGQEKWTIVKTLTYSLGLTIMTFAVMSLLVVLF